MIDYNNRCMLDYFVYFAEWLLQIILSIGGLIQYAFLPAIKDTKEDKNEESKENTVGHFDLGYDFHHVRIFIIGGSNTKGGY